MATHPAKRTRARNPRAGDRGRRPYRFKAEEVVRMVEAGIIPAGVELWDGVIYRMTKKELHNSIVGAVADALRPLTPAGYHVREEKSCQDGDSTLPEPDVAVARGRLFDYVPDVPPLTRMALIVEVNHHSAQADRVEKPRRYAEVGVPVYWVVEVVDRQVVVQSRPQGAGDDAGYADRTTFGSGQDVPVVIDGREVGRVAVSDLFPPAPAPAD